MHVPITCFNLIKKKINILYFNLPLVVNMSDIGIILGHKITQVTYFYGFASVVAHRSLTTTAWDIIKQFWNVASLRYI